MPTKRTARAALVAAGTVVLSTIAVSGPAQAAAGRQAVPLTKPAWLSHAKHLGAAGDGAAVQARVYLAPNGGLAALRSAALAMSTPGSASYRHFLTPQ